MRLPLTLLLSSAFGVLCMLSIAYLASDARNTHATDEGSSTPAIIRVIPKEAESHQSSSLYSRMQRVFERKVQREEKTQSLLPIVNQPDIRDTDKVLLDQIFRWLPDTCHTNLKHLVVRYDPKAQRGLSTETTMILRGENMSAQEKIGVVTHECGHIIDLGALKGTKRSGESNYPDGSIPTFNDDPSVLFYTLSWIDPDNKKSSAKKIDFASGYAMHDPWEDLAETFTAYLLDNAALRERAEKSDVLMQKIVWIETYVIPNGFALPESSGIGNRYVWDWTKEPHRVLDLL